jgi:hypothetical protein
MIKWEMSTDLDSDSMLSVLGFVRRTCSSSGNPIVDGIERLDWPRIDREMDLPSGKSLEENICPRGRLPTFGGAVLKAVAFCFEVVLVASTAMKGEWSAEVARRVEVMPGRRRNAACRTGIHR